MSIELKEHEVVFLVEDISSEGLDEGASGTIVHMYDSGNVCEVEFAGSRIITLRLDQIRPSNM